MNTDLFAPALIQALFTFLIVFTMGFSRFFAVRSGAVKGRAIALGQRAWPEHVQRLSNVANNQWESPTLFFAAIAFALILEAQSPLLPALAWAYMATRVLHAAIYVAVNHVLTRFLTFGAGLLILMAFWIVLGVEILSR
jgi:hypothetical protein